MPADRTPGQVAHAAYERAHVQAVGSGSPVLWGQIHSRMRPVWEAVAQAVREQVGGMDDRGAEAISRLGALQRRLARWEARDFGPNYDQAYQELIDIVEPFFPAEPKLEAEEECAETAGAEQSKSPPPAER